MAFLHIPKCGGTTVRNIMKLNYNPWMVFAFMVSGRRLQGGIPLSFDAEDSSVIKAIKGHLASKHHKIECVLGHMPYGIHYFIPN
jgi:hypothetical protein